MKIYEGKLVSEGMKIGIVIARFNEFITSKLLSGALDGLVRENVRKDDIEIAWVPGAFEIPLVASKMVKSNKYHAIICLGAVIRENTDHYNYVCSEVSKGIAFRPVVAACRPGSWRLHPGGRAAAGFRQRAGG